MACHDHELTRTGRTRSRLSGQWGGSFVTVLWLAVCCPSVRGQGPQVDVSGPPGAVTGGSRLGPQPGALDVSTGDSGPSQGLLSVRPGPSSGKIPLAQLNPGTRTGPSLPEASFRPRVLEPATVPRYGALAIPPGPEDIGPEDGLTLDGAIDRLLQKDLSLIALRYEIPMAEADVR